MTVVFATGCANSGWDIVTPLLGQLGLEIEADDFSQWNDEFFLNTRLADPSTLSNVAQGDASMLKKSMEIMSRVSSKPCLFSDSRTLWLLDFWARQCPKALFLLFYTRPEIAFTCAVSHNLEPRRFLSNWQSANRELIRFQSHNRQRTILLDAEAANRQPNSLVDACSPLGLNLRSTKYLSSPSPSISPLDRFVARHLVTMIRPSIQVLCTELEARTPPVNGSPSTLDLQTNELLASYLKQKAFEQKAYYTKQLLISQLTQVQNELENYLPQQNSKRTRFAKIRQSFEQFMKKIEKNMNTRKELKLLRNSDLFDVRWYLSEYTDIARAGIDPIEHYVKHGASEGRNPSRSFNTKYYLESNPDVALSAKNPLVHFIQFGRKEGRKISPCSALPSGSALSSDTSKRSADLHDCNTRQ